MTAPTLIEAARAVIDAHEDWRQRTGRAGEPLDKLFADLRARGVRQWMRGAR